MGSLPRRRVGGAGASSRATYKLQIANAQYKLATDGESAIMDLRLLRYFIAVAEELSFTRAAERLYIAQPSLSQQIRQLEAFVGTPLFLRDKHRIELSEAGRIFLREARAMLTSMEHAVTLARQAARAEAGIITIAVVPGPERKVFSAVLATLLRKYPRIQVVLRSLTSPEQVAALKNRDINVGVLRGPIQDEEIASEILVREDFIVLLPSDQALAREKRIALPKLAALPHIGVSRVVAPGLHDAVNQIAAAAGVHFQTLFEGESITAILNAVAAGLGFALHTAYTEQIIPKNVVARPLDLAPVPQLELLVAYRKDDKLPALNSFLTLLRASAYSPEAHG
jgi:LysR family hca operon transcriptional activator